MCFIELGGELSAGHSCGSTLWCERSRSLHSYHGLHHICPGGWAGPRHTEQVHMQHAHFLFLPGTTDYTVHSIRILCAHQVFTRAAGSSGQLGVGVVNNGSSGSTAFTLPSDRKHRPHHYRLAGIFWLQICWVCMTSSFHFCVYISIMTSPVLRVSQLFILSWWLIPNLWLCMWSLGWLWV